MKAILERKNHCVQCRRILLLYVRYWEFFSHFFVARLRSLKYNLCAWLIETVSVEVACSLKSLSFDQKNSNKKREKNHVCRK